MTTANDMIESGTSPKLRPAGNVALRPAQQPAGPFEVPTQRREPTVRDALITGLLVIYQAFAAVAAIIAELFLAGAGSI
ncbi:hypothetical protein [Mesorhizobium sp. CA4]|uniref:hypothetical protein n=1 Tax=Mesorhizobium sp. CA4 TaxID=588499 RepID=UPI001CD0FBE3|nr:hypothetical protein [Mesorhizobium sp. CA4]MBZ9823006.1 hypothetical protein [Mesorhizobium sp. CA4]